MSMYDVKSAKCVTCRKSFKVLKNAVAPPTECHRHRTVVGLGLAEVDPTRRDPWGGPWVVRVVGPAPEGSKVGDQVGDLVVVQCLLGLRRPLADYLAEGWPLADGDPHRCRPHAGSWQHGYVVEVHPARRYQVRLLGGASASERRLNSAAISP